jgi:type VI secretion system secreted protein Hcp
MADDYFLRIDGIQGESPDPKHKDEIQLVTFDWGLSNASNPVGGGGGGGARPQFKDFSFTMLINKASPQLFIACASGKHFKNAFLTARRAAKGEPEYLTIRFDDVIVTSFGEVGSGEGPEETVSLGFRRIEFEYRQQTPQGALGPPVKAGWDLSKNQPA